MPIKKYMLNVDGKDHQVSEKNIEKYGIESYAKNYPGATIRMRDDKDSDYDIPINEYQRAVDSGLKPFVTSYYKDEEEEITERSTFQPDSVVYMNQTSQPAKLDVTQGKGSQSVPETIKTGTDSTTNVPEMNEMGTQVAVKSADSTQTQPVKSQNVPVVDKSMMDAWEQRINREKFVPASKTVSKKDDTLGKDIQKTSDIPDAEWKKPATYQDYMNELVSEWEGTPHAYPETRSEQMQREASANASAADKIWNGELKGVVDGLIEQGREEGRAKIREYQKTVYGNGGIFSGAAGMGDQSHKEYAKATDAKKVIEGVQQYLAEKNGAQTGGEEGVTNPLQEQLMQKVYDYLVQKNTPKSTAEYIMRNVFSGSILGQLMSMGDGKSYEQRQIETGGLQQYQPSAGEEIGAMAASVATDLPVMAVTGAVGGVAGNALLNGATKRLMASGLSEAAARAIATRAAQQTGMKWALRTASEAVNFGTLEGLGSMVGQAYQTGDVDLGKAATAMAKGAATGAVMGVFGVSNDKFRGMMEGGLGETAGRALGYTTSLGGRTAILTGSSVFGQYLEDPNFDINNVDWTKEIAHAGLMNLGFDILGAVKRYQAYRKTGIRMRDIEKLNLSKEDIAQLNEAGINGKDAQEIAESILQVKDAKELKRDAPEGKGLVPSDFGFASQELGVSKEGSVLGQLLSNENIDLATKAKVAYLMTGMQFRLAPNTNVSDVQEQADGSFTVEKFNPSGQTNETRRFKTRQEAEKYRHDMQNEVMPNQVNVLEGMMDNAGKMNTATRIFDMVAKMYNTGKEQIAEAYAKGKRGEELTGREAQAFKTIDDLLNSIQSSEDYQFSTRQLKNRMDEAYGQKTGWMDNVLKKKYNSLNETERRAYDEYISNMKSILQGNQRERLQIGGEAESTVSESGITPLLENQTQETAMQMEPVNAPALPGSTISAPAVPASSESAPSTKRTAARETGAALYTEHDPAKMRQAVVRQQVARERLRNSGMLDEAIDAIGEADDANRDALLSGLDSNQRRLAEDYLQQTDVVDGMNEALTMAHLPEAEAAETLAQNMVSPHGKIVVVALGKNEDPTHKYGVVVNGIDATGNLVSPEGQIIVVPLEASDIANIDFSTFDDSKAISMRMEDAWGDVSQLEAEYVMDSMLSAAQEDENILEGQTPIVPGQTVLLADTEGNTVGAQVVGGSRESGWMVMEEGTNEPSAITEEELREMMLNAERIPIMQEYEAADKAYEREQREIQRQEERAVQKAREAEEAARIAEEMKKPINRLAKYPEGHKNAGKPDYENSQPEDVRAYLVESLGLDGAVKSMRNMRTSLEKQVAEQSAKIETIRTEMEESDFFPDEAIAARELLAEEEMNLTEAQRKLDFWKVMERITAGPTQEEAQAAVTRSEAQQKAAKTKREVYKPSDDYRKMQKDLSDSETALSVLNDLEPHTPEELAAQLISGGVRLMKADEQVGDTTLKGVMSMTGYGQADLQRLNFVFATRANGGVSVGEFGEMLEQSAKDAGIRFDGKTQEEGANALLSLLGEVETMGDISRYVERNRMREAQKLYDEEQKHFEDILEKVTWEEYGMSYADYRKLQDAITSIVEIRAGFTQDFRESETYKDFISNFAANIADNGQEGNDNAGRPGGIAEVGDNVADGTGNLVEGNQEPAGSVRPVAEISTGREQGAQAPQGTAENRPADGNGNDVPVSSGQGTGSDEGHKLVPATGREGKEGNAEAYVVEKRHHAKLDQDVWAVKFTERFDRDKFLELKKEVKKFRGYYSSYGKGGFIFEDEAHARKFAESVVGVEAPAASAIEQARAEVNTNPSEAQKEAGNYKMGHLKLDGYDITIENPKGSVRSGKDANGKEWRTTMNNDYGYIRGTKAVDGDHIDVFLSDKPEEGRVFVVDQTNQDGSFDESKVMYGFNSLEEAREAYLSNYDAGWESRIMAITEVSKEEFKKWIDSSTRKTKAFSEYKSVKPAEGNELKPTYDEQGRETIESQAGRSRGEAERLASEAESGSLEAASAAGRGSGTSGNRPAESAGGSRKPESVNGYRIGEKVLYKGKEATIYEFENDGTPVLDTGMAPVIYEVGYWDSIEKLPTTVEQINRIAEAAKPSKKLERAERSRKKNQAKREKQQEQMVDLFSQVDAMEEKLVRQEQEIDAQLALLSEYKAGPKAQVREDMHTGAAKALEKAGRKFAKALASRLGGHVDGKDISNELTNIAPIGGDMVFRVWLDDADTQGVMMLINFDAAPDTKDFDKLVPKYGFWRMISDKDRSGVRNSNHNFYIESMSELESGALMSRIADDMLSALNREAVKASNVTTEKRPETTAERPKTNEVLTNKKEEDGRNQGTDPGMGTEARQEAGRTEPGRDDRGVHGNNVPDTQGSGRVSERDGEQQPSVNEPSPVAASVKRNTHNWSYGETHLELPTGEIGKLKGNIEAIRTLKELEASGQPATPEQKQALLKFVGWGGLAEALNSAEYADWQRKVKEAQRWGWSETGAATSWSKKWGKHYEDLRPLMTDEEWATAQASTLNSHYTPETVIRGLWEALEYMGFKGGSIQEPAMGVGHILGFMPKTISERSMLSGFELDSIPGRIAKQLYPDADITVAGYETQFRPSSKDAIVTNVPFGQTAPVDPALDKALRKKLGSSYNLHNYFIIKGLLELRPGGVGAFITSAATMDGRNTKAREYISSLGVDLVGAIRLPNSTFKANAGTEVTADMLFFRKRLPGEAGNGIAFTSLTQVGTGKNKVQDKKGNDTLVDVPLLVNEYFAERPEMMLGEVMTAHDAGSGGLYGGDNLTLVARPGTELAAELADAIGRLPENVFEKGTVSGKPTVPGEATTQKDGTLSVKDGKVYVASKGELSEIASGTFKHNGKSRSYADATKDYQTLKETLKELIQAEQSQTEDPVELRKQLNEQYDRFVEKYGRLNENKNLNVVMEEDPERFLPQALEKVETVTNPTTGRRTKVVSKGDGILAKRVSQPMTEPTTAENLGDAIGISQAYRGRMDVGYIADMLGISADEARERILAEREAYEDPVTGDLVDRDAYLSGNIREKLETARAAAEKDSRYEQNVTDLEKSMPESIPFVDIFYKMGTPWIPEDVYEDFGREVCGIENMQISYAPVIDQFVVNKGYISDFTKAGNFATTRRNAMQLFEDAINLRKPVIMKTVTDSHGKEIQVRDEQATQEAIQAVMDMNDAFIQYIQEAKPLHARLTSIYNDRYNNYRLREYREPAFKGADGKVHYPNANPALTLRKHQVKAVQRSLQGSTLLAHQVGTGKTFTMITTAMEMRRLGLAKKPMIVVQNATLQDFAADFMKLYPSAKILVPNETERSASQRKRLFNLIATGDFDAIIVPQSFLAFIPDDEGRKKALIMARVDEIMAAADALQYTDKQLANKLKREAEALELSLSGEEKASKKGGKRVKDQAKKQESALVRETQKLDRRTDDVLTFEQMGVDALFIDEAHNYKKIGFTTKMQNVKGVDTGYSERANSLYLKVSYVQEKNGGRNVILATGTPITNTMAEVWTMMRFVAPEILQDYGIRTFDEFAATFGQVEPSLEQNSTGGFKIADRFKSYVNVPELVKAFRSHADVVLTTDVEEFKESKNIPKLKDGRMTNHVIQKSDKLQDVMDVLIAALKEDEKKSGKEKTPGLPLVVFSKAKQAAIDLRLINPEYADDPDSKTNRVVSEVMRIYKESTPDKGIQMVFCDSYQSPASAPAIDLFDYDPSVPQFNLYRDIKNKLIEAGIPKDEIVIVSEITNADRKKAVFEKARAGAVRVLIGSTEKMGVGVNVQERMIALHHMDAPIRPMDFEQRNGRILRQGNMFAAMDKPVEVLTYGVEGTLDATAYERLRIKQDFINQMMKGDVSGRVMEESDDEDPSGKTFSQMAAELSGDKTLQLLFIAENKVKKLEGLRRSHEMKREQARVEAAMLKTDIVRLKNKLKDAEKVGEQVAKRFPEGVTKLTINGRPVTEKLSKVLAETLEDYEGRYALNRSVVFPVIDLNDKAAKMVFGHTLGQLQYSLFMDKFQLVDEKPINTYAGVWLSLNSALANSGKRAEEIRQAIATSEARIKGAESIQEKEFDKMDELKDRRKEVKDLKAELAKKAENASTPTGDVKLAKKNLKIGEKPVSLPEEMAGDSEESLDRMEQAMKPFEEVAVNAPEMVIAQSGSDILSAMPRVEPLQFAKVVTEANRPEVQAMYVPWTKQIIMLPKHGTVKEMRDKRWHESFHFALDMVLPQGDAGRLMLERAAGEVNKLAPTLSKWVEDTYGNRNTSEEKLVHMLEEVLSYMEDAGKVKSIRGGLDFGSQYPVLNEISNKVINYLTNNGHGKETDNHSGYDEGSEPTYRGEDQEGRNEEDFAGVRGISTEGREEIKENRSKENPQDLTTYSASQSSEESNPIWKEVLDSIESASRINIPDITDISKSDDAKVRRNDGIIKNLDEIYNSLSDNSVYSPNELIGQIALGLGIKNVVSNVSNYKPIEVSDGERISIRVSNHYGNAIYFEVKNDNNENNYGVVVKTSNSRFRPDERVNYLEFVYYGDHVEGNAALQKAITAGVRTLVSEGSIKDMPEPDRLNSSGKFKVIVEKAKQDAGIRFGLRGKPRRKAGESLIAYNRRLKEWQQEVEEAKKRRDVENMDVENPLDSELNDLAMEMMNHPTPIRKPGESDADFNARQQEWSEWYTNRMPEINRRMSEIKVQLENEKAAARSKEIKRTEEPLYTGEVPPQKDDEGQLSDEEMREVREIFQEKLADMKISVEKDQIKRDIKQEIIERRRYIETSNLEDTFFVDKVKKVAGSKEVLKAIPDYIEGTYTGEVSTELVEASKLVSDWFEEVYNLMAMEGVLYDAPQIQNYVTHIWDWKRTPKEAQERYANWVNTMRLRSPFTKHRVIPSYKEGIAMGMVPKYDDITGILLEYGHYATETIANKRMIEFLRNFKVMVPGGKDNLPMEMDIIVPDKVKDPMYSRMNHTALDGYKVLTQIKPMITPVFGDQRIIDPSHLTPLANKLIDGIWATSGLMKKIALSFSFFHHGALTETAIAMLGPANAGKVVGKDILWNSVIKGGVKALGRLLHRGKFTKTLAKNLMWDMITKGNIPALNDKEAARDAVKHLVSLGASNDYVTADVNNLTTSLHRFLKDKNVHVAKEAAYVLDFLNKGSDKFLWDTIHDGFKIASFAKMAKEIRAKAESEGWSQEELEKSLDEAGHLVNDTFGGLHFDILGFSPKSVRMMRALLLSPDWTLATIRQALSPLGFGKLYGNEGFWNTIAGGEKPVQMRKKYGRAFWVTAGIFFYALMNGLNAYFRAADEDEEKKEADEMRKVDPSYKSPYELAYPNGMKWYDYTMLGNTLGHQTHLFTGRYEDGTETYARWGKQFRELPELFFGRDGFSFPGPMIDKMSGKANPLLATTFEFVSGHNLSGWENAQMKDKKGWERDVARLHMLAMKFVPYSMPTQEDKEWYWLDLIMPSSKGFSSGKAIGYFEKGIKSGDMDYIAAVYNACVMNGVNPEQSFNVAKARIEAETKRETLEGVETVQDAMRMFDEATDVKERKRLLRYIEQQTGAQDYQAISQEEMVQQANDVINGNDVKVEASDYYLEHATGEDVMEDYRMKKTQAGLKKYHQDYTELMMENPSAGQRMLKEKRKFIEGYVMTSKYRNAINKVKKAMKDGRIEANKGMEEIRKIRREYFENLDKLEVK